MALDQISLDQLYLEYSNWQVDNGNGRDENGIRFGQYIWNNYDLDKIFPTRDAANDGFNSESASDAVAIISKQLIKQS